MCLPDIIAAGPVALRKESVDRNIADYAKPEWLRVALRKESVDRNVKILFSFVHRIQSLSARRAWIEIGPAYQSQAQAAGRSPQGERG